MALLILAGLQMIPGDMYEAGAIDGATGIRKFFFLTLPFIMPTLLVALIFRTLDALRVFDIFYIMVGGAGDMATMATYNQAAADRLSWMRVWVPRPLSSSSYSSWFS